VHKILTILILIASQAVGAGWDTSVWPAYTVQRKGREQAEDCYHAVRERALASRSTVPTAPSWWRSQRSMLIDQKAKFKACLGVRTYIHQMGNWTITANIWIDKGATGNYLDWLKNNRSSSVIITSNLTRAEAPIVFPRITLDMIYATNNLPTNYFDHTPWRCLNGLGPFDDDASVGHNHGWTNEYTAVGGSNFPSGRSTWYTTDYGWDGIKAAVGNLVACDASLKSGEYLFYGYTGVSTSHSSTERPYTNTMAAAWSDAEDRFNAGINPIYPPYHGEFYACSCWSLLYTNNAYYASFGRSRARVTLEKPGGTNLKSRFNLYAHVLDQDWLDWIESDYTIDFNGDTGIEEGWNLMTDSVYWRATDYEKYIPANHPPSVTTVPNTSPEPTDTHDSTIQGYSVGGEWVVTVNTVTHEYVSHPQSTGIWEFDFDYD